MEKSTKAAVQLSHSKSFQAASTPAFKLYLEWALAQGIIMNKVKRPRSANSNLATLPSCFHDSIRHSHRISS